MKPTQIAATVQDKRQFFNTHKTLPYAYRLFMLKRLQDSILAHQEAIYDALKADLNKSRYEAHLTEVALVIGDINHTIKKLKAWMKPKAYKVALTQMPASDCVYNDPYGVVLIMSPWNYPFQLTMIPLIGAIAAGNCVVVKPSAYSAHTTAVIDAIIKQAFTSQYVSVVTGGREENQSLLDQTFDYIFFTGSPIVGKIVMKKASETLTPVTLELGGKSPCIVDKTADIKRTAKRILFGKLLNAGQTCVAPDYLLVHASVKEKLVEQLKALAEQMWGDVEYVRNHVPKVINLKHYERLKGYLKEGKIITGGEFDDINRQISFTMIEQMDLNGPLMTEEIFGPILPIISWSSIDQVIKFVGERPKPLSLYLFTKDKRIERLVTEQISYGGGCINDTLLHISAANQPFGGVGNSGMGAYHGYETFKTFSHQKNVLKKWWLFDLAVRYHPYKKPQSTLPQFLFHSR